MTGVLFPESRLMRDFADAAMHHVQRDLVHAVPAVAQTAVRAQLNRAAAGALAELARGPRGECPPPPRDTGAPALYNFTGACARGAHPCFSGGDLLRTATLLVRRRLFEMVSHVRALRCAHALGVCSGATLQALQFLRRWPSCGGSCGVSVFLIC